MPDVRSFAERATGYDSAGALTQCLEAVAQAETWHKRSILEPENPDLKPQTQTVSPKMPAVRARMPKLRPKL